MKAHVNIYPCYGFPSSMIEWITENGAFICVPDYSTWKRLEGIMRKIQELFSEVIGEVSMCLYCYDNERSMRSFSVADGMWSFNGNLHAIGIGTKAFDESDDYLAFLILHEITHMLIGSGEHNEEFHQYLDYLIMKFNEAYDTKLQNDYSGYRGEVI